MARRHERGGNPVGVASRYCYTGQRLDPETGLHHYKARSYSAALGRFLQPDAIGYRDGLHLYAYLANDPVNLADPSGLAAEAARAQLGQFASASLNLVKSGALVPGGTLSNEAYASIRRGDYVSAGLQFTAGLGEAAVAVATLARGAPSLPELEPS